MTDATKSRSEMETLYTKVEGLIKCICRKQAEYHGSCFEECLSIAHESFCKAAHSYDPTKGPFHKRVAFLIKQGFCDNYRKLNGRGVRPKVIHMPLEDLDQVGICDRHQENISKDAIRLQNALIEFSKNGYYKNPRGIKASVILHLRDCGWNCCRISSAFRELKDGITCS